MAAVDSLLNYQFRIEDLPYSNKHSAFFLIPAFSSPRFSLAGSKTAQKRRTTAVNLRLIVVAYPRPVLSMRQNDPALEVVPEAH